MSQVDGLSTTSRLVFRVGVYQDRRQPEHGAHELGLGVARQRVNPVREREVTNPARPTGGDVAHLRKAA